ncbi:MAG: MFS transporter, partial [Actinomycetota bacterium]|nr:MFS transporter [Actinomycetota bacterium]
VVIDRWNRRRLLFLSNALRAGLVLMIALFGVSTTADDPVKGLIVAEALPSVYLFVVFMVTLACTRLLLATKAAALPVTLEGHSLVEGNAVSQLGGALFQLGAGGIAFVASAVLPSGPIVLVGAIVYGVAATVALAIHRAEEQTIRSRLVDEIVKVIGNIVAGLREVARTAKAGAAITTYFWLRFLWSFTIVGVGFIARDLVADDDLKVLIVTGGAGAIGAALGFLLAARLTDRFTTTAYLVMAASFVAGAAAALLGSFETLLTLSLLAFFLGLGFFLAKISLDTMVQEALGDDFRGRAFSLYDIAYNIAWVAAAAIMQLLWTEALRGALVAGMGVVFIIGMAAIGTWFKRAGLLAAP